MDIITRIKDIYKTAKKLSDEIDAAFQREQNPARIGMALSMKSRISGEFMELRNVILAHEDSESEKLRDELTRIELNIKVHRRNWEHLKDGGTKR